jgi:glycerophosphoryl diester phosphodiesterase
MARKVGADVVEFDLKKTKDGKLVVMHDPTLNRTTTGTGLVSDHTLEELKKLKLRAGTGHPTDDTIPTFAEELDAARENGLVLDTLSTHSTPRVVARPEWLLCSVTPLAIGHRPQIDRFLSASFLTLGLDHRIFACLRS